MAGNAIGSAAVVIRADTSGLKEDMALTKQIMAKADADIKKRIIEDKAKSMSFDAGAEARRQLADAARSRAVRHEFNRQKFGASGGLVSGVQDAKMALMGPLGVGLAAAGGALAAGLAAVRHVNPGRMAAFDASLERITAAFAKLVTPVADFATTIVSAIADIADMLTSKKGDDRPEDPGRIDARRDWLVGEVTSVLAPISKAPLFGKGSRNEVAARVSAAMDRPGAFAEFSKIIEDMKNGGLAKSDKFSVTSAEQFGEHAIVAALQSGGKATVEQQQLEAMQRIEAILAGHGDPHAARRGLDGRT